MNHDSEFSNDDTGRYCLQSLRASHWRLTGRCLDTDWTLTGH